MSPAKFLRRAHRRGILIGEVTTRFAKRTCAAIERRWYRERTREGQLALCAYRRPEEDWDDEAQAYLLHYHGAARVALNYWWWFRWCDTSLVDGLEAVAEWADHMNAFPVLRETIEAEMLCDEILGDLEFTGLQ